MNNVDDSVVAVASPNNKFMRAMDSIKSDEVLFHFYVAS